MVLISLSVAFDAFHVFPAATPREVSTYACIFPSAVAAHRWSCLGPLPRPTVSQEGPKSKLLWGLCNGTVWEERRGPAHVGPSPLMLRWLLVAQRSHRQTEVQTRRISKQPSCSRRKANPGGGKKNKHGRCALHQWFSTASASGPTFFSSSWSRNPKR